MSIKIVLTATNVAKVATHVFVPVIGASKDMSIQVTVLLPTEIVKEVFMYFLLLMIKSHRRMSKDGKSRHCYSFLV